MADKKNVSVKKQKTTKKKEETSKKTKAKNTKTKEIKEEVIVETKEVPKKIKKECKIKKWFDKITLEQIVIAGIVIISILLIVLISVSTKNTKTKNGDDIVVKIKGKTITADDLYEALKEKAGKDIAINLVDEYILEKEYKTTDDMKKSAQNTVDNYKSNYGDSYQSFLEYNGIKNDAELKEILIKNSKLTKVTENYIKKTLTEKEMKEYYEKNIYGDISAKHILISTETEESATDEEKDKKDKDAKAKAEELITRIKNGESFDSLAKEFSDDTGTKEKGGDLGYFNTGAMVKEFEDAAYKLNVNEYTTTPVKTTYGYHIIMKTGQKEKPSYKKSKDTIIEKLIEQKQEDDETISVKAMNALREEYKINIKDKTIKKEYQTYLKESTTTTKAAE